MDFIFRLIAFILTLLTAYFFTKMTNAIVPLKPTGWRRIPLILAFSAVSCVIIYNHDIVNITYAFAGYLILLLLTAQGTFIEKISPAFILYPLVVSLNYIMDYFMMMGHVALYSDDPSIHLSECTKTLLLQSLLPTIRYVILALFWFGMDRGFQKRLKSLRHFLTPQTRLLLNVISLAPLFSTSYIIVISTDKMKTIILPVIFVTIITSVGILYLVTQMAETSRLSAENEALHLQENYYRELERSHQEIRKLRHDMNNHLATINSYLTNNEPQKARAYFQKLSGTVQDTNRSFCKNGLVNAVLNTKYNQAQNCQIDTFFHINLTDDLPIDDIDLCSLLSNTLDNAIEACMQVPDISFRKMEVKARCEKGFFSYQVTNSFTHVLQISKGVYRSTKKDSGNHGYGISRIQDIVKKYQGTLDIRQNGSEFILTAILPLTIQSNTI